MTLLTTENTIALSERLSSIASVNRFDTPDEPQGVTIAHAVADIQRSCHDVLEVIMPQLIAASSVTDIEDALTDLGEELRHILYHVRDTRYFSYLTEVASLPHME